MSLDLIKTYNALGSALDEKGSALPAGFNKDRFMQNCMSVLTESKDLQACDMQSVKRTLLKGALLGLDFFNKECYAIKYGNSCQFQTDYKGEKKLAKLYSIRPIEDIYAKLVREGDVLIEKIVNGRPTIDFEPKPFNNGAIIGAFAVALFKDGTMSYETMSVEDIENVRKSYSKAPNSPAWKNSYGEMCKKTVLRRLCKGIELNFESIEQKKVFDEAGDCTFDNQLRNDVQADIEENANSINFDEVIEAEATIVEENEMPDFLQD